MISNVLCLKPKISNDTGISTEDIYCFRSIGMMKKYLLLSTDCYFLEENEVLQTQVNGRKEKSR